MKTKTIKKQLAEVITDWTGSITDTRTRTLAQKHSIITGGSIASMLLGEEVNDYDIYFDNAEAVESIANYYLKQARELSKASNDEMCLNVIEGDDNEPKRFKIFIRSSGVLRVENEKKFGVIYLSSNAITLNNDVQLVIRFYGTPEEIHKNYDFVHATNYYYKTRLVLNRDALECLLTKELRYFGSKYPLASIIRTRKFIQRGWSINAGQYLKMALQLNQLDLSDICVLEEQLTGVDVAYFSTLLETLKRELANGNKAISEYGYLASIIDKIF